jgi:hypothetical protein
MYMCVCDLGLPCSIPQASGHWSPLLQGTPGQAWLLGELKLRPAPGQLVSRVCQDATLSPLTCPTGAAQVFNGSVVTKWLDYGGGGHQGTAWVEFKLLGQVRPCQLSLAA